MGVGEATQRITVQQKRAMLAPRKILWSSPSSAVQRAYTVSPLSESDVVVDIGCGDGKVLLQWAILYSANQNPDENCCATATATAPDTTPKGPSFIGIDMDSVRIQTAEYSWKEAMLARQIDSRISSQFHCANALADGFWKDSATVLYLYLTPRGMRQLRPVLDECPKLRLVISYMNTLADAKLLAREVISVPHQPDAAWPLYIYQLPGSADESDE